MKSVRELARSVGTVAAGSAASQAVGILAAPVLGRIYPPEAFGALANVIAVSTIAAVIFGGRFDYAILLPRRERTAEALFAGMTLVGALGGVVGISAVTFLARKGFGGWPRFDGRIASAACVSGVLYVYLAASSALLNRKCRYRRLVAAGVCQAITNAVFSSILGVVGAKGGGLVVGFLAGQVVGCIVARSSLELSGWPGGLRRKARMVVLSMWRFRRFPVLSVPAGLVETGAQQVPVLAIGAIFGPAALGVFSMAQRLTRLPLSLVSGAVGTVFRREAAAAWGREQNCRRETTRTALFLATMSIVPAVLLGLFAPTAFKIALGAQWTRSGEVARLLLPALILQFVVSPISNVLFIAGRNAVDLAIQLGLLALTATAFWLAAEWHWSLDKALAAYITVYCTKYLLEGGLAIRWSKGVRRLQPEEAA